MAGIYFHIPYCKQACHYCDFHFSTNFRNIEELVGSLKKEIQLQKGFLDSEKINTIYFGGGTPSAIPTRYIDELIKEVHSNFSVDQNAEITLEANPDDLLEENLLQWKKSGINRLSVGVQSFFDKSLKEMNRAHNSAQALKGLKLAQEIGITNITMDLIYGIPGMTTAEWNANLDLFFKLEIPHLSAYGLTIEPNTHLGHLVQHDKLAVEKDVTYNIQFEILMERAVENGFDHYEISNFGKPNYHSKHNTAYWFGEKYIGIGPSAHSFNGEVRQWNVSSNAKYITSIIDGKVPFEKENLSEMDRYNEYILTHLRTQWGIDENQIKTQFGATFQNNLKLQIEPYLQSKHVLKMGNFYVLSRKGKFLADKISSDLFVVA